jgi:chromosome segregation ATPase
MKEQLLQLSYTLSSCQAQLKQNEEVKHLIETELHTLRKSNSKLQENLKATKLDARRRELSMNSLQDSYTAMSKELLQCKIALKNREDECYRDNDRLKAEVQRLQEQLKQKGTGVSEQC